MTASRFQLAQLNIALAREPLDTPLLADFVAAIAPVNAAADASPGFVWRLATPDGDATGIRAFDDERLVVNLSVWESLAALRAFVYSQRAHRAVLRRRRKWFERLGESAVVLWWVPEGHRPSIAEAEQRLNALRADGPTAAAFTFRESFEPPQRESSTSAGPLDQSVLCPAD
jgi:heme-degrading monooxygenase HmoA